MKSKEDIVEDANGMVARLFPPQPESCCLTVMCRAQDYSASAIARAVEDADAHLLNLNVTADRGASGETVVELRISHRDAGRAAASLGRYGYVVTDVDQNGYDHRMDVLQERINDLLRRMNV